MTTEAVQLAEIDEREFLIYVGILISGAVIAFAGLFTRIFAAVIIGTMIALAGIGLQFILALTLVLRKRRASA